MLAQPVVSAGAVVQGASSANAAAEDRQEPWPDATVAVLRSFFERAHVDEVLLGIRPPGVAPSGGDTVDRQAAALGSVDAVFRFVQRRVAFQAYAGSVLGARGSLRALRGNALDQAVLLVALCRSLGRRSHLVRGRLRWRDAVRLVGPQPPELTAGDPWLRRVEMAADHWWAEVETPEGWLEMDPSFPDVDPGGVPGVGREIHDESPADLVAMARLAVVVPRTGRELLRAELPAGEIVGLGARVIPERRPLEIPADGGVDTRADSEAAGDGTLEEDADALDRHLLELRQPVEVLRVRVGERERAVSMAGIGSDEPLELRVRIQAPLEEPVVMRVGFRPAEGASLALVAESGVSHVETAVLPVYRALQELSERENAALVAYRERPTEGDAERAPAERQADSVRGGIEGGDEELHPARALQLAGLRAWERFEGAFPDALGHVLLAAAERLRAGGALERAPLRLAAVRWRPPGSERGGEVTVWAADEVVFRGGSPSSRRGTESAFGFLQSAMMGQVLHQVADGAPLTAFDLTLRSVGTGQRLVWMEPGTAIPDSWPAAAARAAQADRRLGRVLVGPRQAPGETGTLGWWAVDPVSGDADGRVVRGDEIAGAAVTLGAPTQPGELASVLASLPDLHAAAGWLVRAADDDSEALDALLPGTCAATTLVSDLLSAGAPRGFVLPDFTALCSGVAVASGRAPS